jgi:hypothetical protein
MNTTLKRLPPATAVKVFTQSRAAPFVHYFEPVPGAALASGTSDAKGDLTLDLPQGVELLAQLPNGTARRVLNSTTRGGTP